VKGKGSSKGYHPFSEAIVRLSARSREIGMKKIQERPALTNMRTGGSFPFFLRRLYRVSGEETLRKNFLIPSK